MTIYLCHYHTNLLMLIFLLDCVSLMLRSRLELNEMIHHPLFAIVFLLEYVVNIPVSQPDIPGGKKVKSKVSGCSICLYFLWKATRKRSFWTPLILFYSKVSRIFHYVIFIRTLDILTLFSKFPGLNHSSFIGLKRA